MSTRTATTTMRVTLQSSMRNTLNSGQATSAVVGGDLVNASLQSGAVASKANRAYERTGWTIASGNTNDFDLYDAGSVDVGAGAGMDSLGQAVLFEEVVALVIMQTAGAGRLEIMPSNPSNYATWVPSMTVANGGALASGGMLLLYKPDEDAFDVADASSHMIRLGANGGEVTVRMLIVGRHDDDVSSSSSSSSSSSASSSSSSSSMSSSSSQSASSKSSSSSSPSSESSQSV